MLKLLDIKSNVFEMGSKTAEIYKYNSHNIPFLQGKISIIPFKKEMENANNIILFIDNNDNITGGQIGSYNIENGLQCILF